MQVFLWTKTPAVGAILADKSKTGVVYVFSYLDNQWKLKQKIFADDLSTGDNFGQSVSINGDTLVVGAYTHNSDNSGGFMYTNEPISLILNL